MLANANLLEISGFDYKLRANNVILGSTYIYIHIYIIRIEIYIHTLIYIYKLSFL